MVWGFFAFHHFIFVQFSESCIKAFSLHMFHFYFQQLPAFPLLLFRGRENTSKKKGHFQLALLMVEGWCVHWHLIPALNPCQRASQQPGASDQSGLLAMEGPLSPTVSLSAH